MVGSERRNSVVVVFMGSQPTGSERNASSCSSGGLGRNRRWKRGLAYRTTEEMALCSTGHVQNGILFIGRGVVYRKMDETDLLRSKRGSYSSGGVWRTAKRDSTGYCSSPPSTSSSLHLRLFIHGLLFSQPPPRATPPATVQPPLHGHPSTIYCSSSPPRGRPIDRLQLAAVAKESLDRVQLTAIDRSLGFSNA